MALFLGGLPPTVAIVQFCVGSVAEEDGGKFRVGLDGDSVGQICGVIIASKMYRESPLRRSLAISVARDVADR